MARGPRPRDRPPTKREQQRAAVAERREEHQRKKELKRRQIDDRIEQRRYSPTANTEWKHLYCTAEQLEELSERYRGAGQLNTVSYDSHSEQDQQAARDRLATVHFQNDASFRQQRFSMVWSWTSLKKEWVRELYQCYCGYSDQERRRRERGDNALPRLLRPFDAPEARPHELARLVPFAFTGCLCHFEVVLSLPERSIRRISGILEHNEQCSAAELRRVPLLPLHSEVIADALAQLMAGSSLNEVHSINAAKALRRAYRAMSGAAAGEVIYQGWRFTMTLSDKKALSRALCLRKYAIDTRIPPHENIHSWLTPE
ncbi:hypothetical protein V8E36_000909 [Tilletia maclaganii]